MNSIIAASTTAGVVLSLLAYWIGALLRKKTGWSFMNPLLISILLVIVFLLVFRVSYADYQASARYLSWFLTPATVSLAIPLYLQLERLKKNIKRLLPMLSEMEAFKVMIA